MDKIRQQIETRMKDLGLSESEVSKRLGKNRAYMNQYLGGTQLTLPYEVKAALAEILEMRLADLGAKPIHGNSSVLLTESEADPYTPPPGSFLVPGPQVAFFKQQSLSLDQHPERLRIGDIAIFDINQSNPANIPTGKIVWVQMLDKRDFLKSLGSILRQFIAPNKLITNSSAMNEIISLDDESLPYEPIIKGTLLSVVRSPS